MPDTHQANETTDPAADQITRRTNQSNPDAFAQSRGARGEGPGVALNPGELEGGALEETARATALGEALRGGAPQA